MKVAVCIPVHRDAAGLDVTLRSLRESGASEEVYVVVGVDGSDAACQEVAVRYDAAAAVLTQQGGSYRARMAALRLVPPSVESVLFTDAGCEIVPGWVDGHLRALAQADLSGGRVEVPLRRRPKPAEFVDARRNLLQETYVMKDGFAATCNLAARREVVDRIGFRTDVESGGDRDFCHRATTAGFRLVYTADATVRHPPRRTWSAVLSKARRQGRGVATMSADVRPVNLPKPRFFLRFGRAHPAGRRPWGVGWLLAVAGLDYLRQRAFVRAARRAGFS